MTEYVGDQNGALPLEGYNRYTVPITLGLAIAKSERNYNLFLKRGVGGAGGSSCIVADIFVATRNMDLSNSNGRPVDTLF